MSAVCSIPGCEKPIKGRGWCNAHLQRWYRHGSPDAEAPLRQRVPPVCGVLGCGKRNFVGGYCKGHYKRLRKYGNPLAGRTPNGELERYFREVVLSYDGDDCLIWPYSRDGHGYGQLFRGGKNFTVSRLVCIEINGPPPGPDYDAAHTCDNGHLGCVAKRHMVWKTHAENMLDLVGKPKLRVDRKPAGVSPSP